MKTSFKAYLAMGEMAVQHERKGEFAFATQKWRSAFRLAPNQEEREWAYARAEHCFKRGIDEKLIAIKKTRELDFKQFMEGKDDGDSRFYCSGDWVDVVGGSAEHRFKSDCRLGL